VPKKISIVLEPCFDGSNHISVGAINSGNTARGLQNFAKPDCSQIDAVLAAVKAWPGEAAACHRQRDGQP